MDSQLKCHCQHLLIRPSLGGVQERRGELHAAGWSWLVAARICPFDVEAFANAFIVFRRADELGLAVTVMQQAFSSFGADFVMELQRRATGAGRDQDSDTTAMLLQALEEMSDLCRETARITSFTRIHQPDDGYDRIEAHDV